MAPADTKVFLGEFETKALFDLGTRAAGTYRVKMMTRGNSLLSSVFVKSLSVGASIEVKYFQTTSGTEDDNERFDLASHGVLSGAIAGKTFQIVVPDIHNKPQCEVIVSGGNVEFGVYATLVGYTVQPGVYLDGQNADLLADGGIPIVVYDDASGKFFLLRSGADGGMAVTVSEPPGKVLTATVSISPSVSAQTVYSGVVPVGKKWRVRYAELVAAGYGAWALHVNALEQGGGYVGPPRMHDRTTLPKFVEATAGQVVEVKYLYEHGPSGIPATAYVGITEL